MEVYLGFPLCQMMQPYHWLVSDPSRIYAILLSLDPNINSALCEILGVNEPEFTAQQVNHIDKAIDIAIPPWRGVWLIKEFEGSTPGLNKVSLFMA